MDKVKNSGIASVVNRKRNIYIFVSTHIEKYSKEINNAVNANTSILPLKKNY